MVHGVNFGVTQCRLQCYAIYSMSWKVRYQSGQQV